MDLTKRNYLKLPFVHTFHWLAYLHVISTRYPSIIAFRIPDRISDLVLPGPRALDHYRYGQQRRNSII